MMMRMRTKLNGNSTSISACGRDDGAVSRVEEGPENWELRPSGMLVQKRLDSNGNIKPPPTIRVRVKYGLIHHEVHISSEATFGELKKMLSGPTGLHHEDQKVYYKDKERDSKEFLDMVGVKDKSKLVLVEDPTSQEKRHLEMRRNARMEKSAKSISEISFHVDKLAAQVAALETVILKGGRVAERDVVNLIEMLMNELIKLDGIMVDGDVKLQRKMQVTRVQKYVEMLDMLKTKNAMPAANEVHIPNGNHQKHPHVRAKSSIFTGNGQIQSNNQERTLKVGKPPLAPKQQQRHSIGHSPLQPQPQEEEQRRHSTSGTVVTTQWEKFESTPPLIALSPTRSTDTTPQKPEKLNFPWELFE